MATSALQIITDALVYLGVISEEQLPSNTKIDRALRQLNQIVSRLSKKQLLTIPSLTREEFAISASQASYTIGSSGDFDTDRPLSIYSAQHKGSEGSYSPIQVLHDEQSYANIVSKSVQGIPERLYYLAAYPLGTIFFDYKPSTTSTIAITSYKPLTAFADTSAEWDLDDAYVNYLTFRLAVELGPSQRADRGQILTCQALADDAMNDITTLNSAQNVPVLQTDPALMPHPGGYNPITDV